MSDTVSKGRFIVVEWKNGEKAKREDNLKTFLKARMPDEDPKIKYGPDKTLALIEFKTEKDPAFLKQKLYKPEYWEIMNIYAVAETRFIKVENMPTGTQSNEIYRFFTNKNNVKMTLTDVKVEEKYLRPKDGVCVIALKSSEEVRKLCNKSKDVLKFRDNKLTISPYYEPTDPLNGDNVAILCVDPITLEDIDGTKLEFLSQFSSDTIDKKFLEKCGRIKWPRRGIKRVVIEFDCPHDDDRRRHSETWKGCAEKMFRDSLDNVKIVRKPLTAAVWSAAREILNTVSGNIWTDEDEKKHLIVLTGFKDDKELMDIEGKIDQIEQPKPVIKKEIKKLDTSRLNAFENLSLSDTIGGVEVVIKTNVIVLRGDENSVKDAETTVLELLNQIAFHESDLPSSGYAEILSSQPIQDKIKAEKEDKGWRCGYTIEGKRLRIYATDTRHTQLLETMIKSHVIEDNIDYTGEVVNRGVLETNLKNVEVEYCPYVKLSMEISEPKVVVHITCPGSYRGPLVEELGKHIDGYLVKEENVPVNPSIVKYIKEKSLDTLKKIIAESKLKEDVLEIIGTTLKIKGNANVRKQVIGFVQELASKIHSHWMSIEREGVHDYMMYDNGYTFVDGIDDKRPCSIRMATQYEMKDTDIYCIIPLESGQAMFVGNGTLTKPNYPVDAIVNAANSQLDHKGGLAKEIVATGGQSIQRDCTAYIEKLGKDLKVGDVYVGTCGRLPCQRLIHAVGPEWKGGNQNESVIMEKLMENILTAMKSEENILRSLAMPLISTGVFGFPKVKAAKILMQTIKAKLKNFPSVREIYFYDPNPDVVRIIQKQMQATFGVNCFHMPTRNVRIGLASVAEFRKSQFFKLKRTGSRTLPLPRNKKLVVQWGDIGKTNADVVVCPTLQAPTPSGVIMQVLNTLAGVQVNLSSECEKNFKTDFNNGNVPDGGLTETKNTGRLPCSTIYCVKIATDKKNVKQNLSKYIEKCLERAVIQKVTNIAFPTIGTSDGNYPAEEVARIFFRSVTDFMKLHPSCPLEMITIVIYHTDMHVTSAFEYVMEEMYSRRPHRLQADIKEQTADGVNGEKEEKEEKKVRPPSPPRRQPTILSVPANKSAQRNMSYNIGSSSNYTVDLETANIEQSTADVIVCTTSSFPKLNGAIASAIKKVGGNSIQDECNRQYQNYPNSGVAMIDAAGQLKCKKVFFVVLQEYKANKNEKSIYHAIWMCLEQAENEKCSSIAFPTFGTGGFKFPGVVSASKTFAAIKNFFQSPRQYLKDVIIALYDKDTNTCQAFRHEVSTNSTFTPMAAPTSDSSSGQQGADKSPPQNVTAGSLTWRVPKASISLEITYGNLALSKADVILNTTTSYPNLNGAISSELCRVAGPQLKQACANYKGVAIEGSVVDETSGFNLKCKKVYHFVMPFWQQISGEKMIEDCVVDCLHKMKQSGLTSIAIPSIGTGGLKYNPMKVARGTYRAVQQFGKDNGGVNCHVNLVLFPAADDVNKTFVNELKAFMGNTSGSPTTMKKGVKFDTGDNKDEKNDNYDTDNDDDIVIPRERRDFVLFQITTDDPQQAKSAMGEIRKMIDKEMKESSVELANDSNANDIALMKGKNWQRVLEFGESYKVKVIMDEKAKKIFVRGFGDGVMDCYQQILNFIRDLRLAERNKGIGQIVYQHIEWYYTEDDGKIWVPYPKSIVYLLEGAFSTQAKDKVFRDSDDKMYVADFNAMVEYEKVEKDQKNTKNKTSVNMIRKDFTEGALKGLPDNWQPMDKGVMLKEITLDPNDPEYQQVEAALNSTKGNVAISAITEIRKIQNQSLYQQYQTTKEQLEKTHQNTVTNIERTLWHGIKEGSEKSINLNGFNRSYSGQTFNDVWYGHGVYFAVNSDYSLQDAYSPPDQAGIRRIYQVKVLTGKTMCVARGYKDRFAPLIPGSQTDRYDSTCDDANNPKEFVIFKDTQSYPEYIIYFKK